MIDPGPADAGHVARVVAEAERRGGVAGIALTHAHLDHAQAVPELRRALRGAGGGRRRQVGSRQGFEEPSVEGLSPDVVLHDGDTFGPLSVIATPGHSLDHVSFVAGRVVFCGDTVLGEGSVFIAPGGNALALYLQSLRRLRALDGSRRCARATARSCGTRPRSSTSTSPTGSTARTGCSTRSRAALRSHDELLDDVWDDAPAALRPAAQLTLEAHLEKLEAEGRLTGGRSASVALERGLSLLRSGLKGARRSRRAGDTGTGSPSGSPTASAISSSIP